MSTTLTSAIRFKIAWGYPNPYKAGQVVELPWALASDLVFANVAEWVRYEPRDMTGAEDKALDSAPKDKMVRAPTAKKNRKKKATRSPAKRRAGVPLAKKKETTDA